MKQPWNCKMTSPSDAFPIKLGTWILCFSCVFQIEILHIKTCIQQKLPTIFHQHIPKFLDYQWAIQVSSPWVGFAGHKRASLQLRKTYGTWVLGLAYPWISTGSGDVISIWGALKGEKVLIRRGLEFFFSDDSKRDLFGNSLLLSGGWQYDPFLLAKNPIFLAEAITFPLDKLFLTYCSICSFHKKLILSVQIEIVGAESRLHPWAVSPSLCPPRWRHPGDRGWRGRIWGASKPLETNFSATKNPQKMEVSPATFRVSTSFTISNGWFLYPYPRPLPKAIVTMMSCRRRRIQNQHLVATQQHSTLIPSGQLT